jgi:hypothetical protein
MTADDREGLAELLRRIGDHEGAFGEIVTHNPDGTSCLPWSRNAPIIDETVRFLLDKHLQVPGFDWGGWEAGRLAIQRCDQAALATCTDQECLQYLTLLVRAERFTEGTLARSFDNGLMQTLLRRLSQLRAH